MIVAPAQRSSRAFRPGQVVRFSPPPGAYSNGSAQAKKAGESGMIVKVLTDDIVSITFGGGVAIIVNAGYLKGD